MFQISGNKRLMHHLRLFGVFMLLFVAVAACGGDDDDDDDDAEPTATTEEASGGDDPTATPEEEDDEGDDAEDEESEGDEGDDEASEEDDFGIDLSDYDNLRLTGAQPSALSVVTYYMVDLMEEWGANVDQIELTNTTGAQALIAGQTDLAGGGTDELILGASAGADILAVASTQDKMDYVLVAQSDIDSVEELEGTSIGMSGPAGYDALLSRLAIREAGMEIDDVNFVQIGGSGDRSAALLSDRIDAATVFLSDWFELERQDEVELNGLVFMDEMVEASTKSTINTSREYADENPDLMFALACANLEAYEWFNEDKDAFVEYTLDLVEGSTEEATSDLYDMLIEIEMYPMEVEELLEVEGVQTIADIMYESGDVDSEVDASELVDRSYLEEAAAAGCGA